MFRVTVRDHMMVAHSLRGARFGPAQALHGATYVVEVTFSSRSLDEDGVVVDIGQATTELHRLLERLTYRNLDEDPTLADRNTTTEVLAEVVAERVVARVRDGALGDAAGRLTAVTVTLRETPDAWASFERAL